MTSINSSRISWNIIKGNESTDWHTVYCADGDGILQVAVYGNRIELLDQLDVCKTWSIDTSISQCLEFSQAFLQSNYPQIYEDSMHWEHDSKSEIFAMLNEIN